MTKSSQSGYLLKIEVFIPANPREPTAMADAAWEVSGARPVGSASAARRWIAADHAREARQALSDAPALSAGDDNLPGDAAVTGNVKADMAQVLGDRDMSIHTQRAMAKARTRGAAAGASANFILWSLSKRELVEIALHLAAALTGNYETSLDDGSAKTRVIDELDALRSNGLL